jgi:recombination associated protein RdgC
MFFKNLQLYRFTEPFTLSAPELEEYLQQRQFRPCGSLEPVSLGWTPVIGETLTHAANGFVMFCLKKEEKLLPTSVVNEIVVERVAEIEEAQGRIVRRKERDGIREEVLQDLLPRAFTHSKKIHAYLDPTGGWLVVDSASAKKAEELCSVLRQCLGSLPVTPIATRERPSAILTHWLTHSEIPAGLTLETECELRSPEEDGGIVKCLRHDLGADEIRNHLEAGKEAVKVALTWNDRLSFVLDETLAIKRLRFLDGVQEEAASVDTEDAAARFDADFALMSLELRNLFDGLFAAFGGLQK